MVGEGAPEPVEVAEAVALRVDVEDPAAVAATGDVVEVPVAAGP